MWKKEIEREERRGKKPKERKFSQMEKKEAAWIFCLARERERKKREILFFFPSFFLLRMSVSWFLLPSFRQMNMMKKNTKISSFSSAERERASEIFSLPWSNLLLLHFLGKTKKHYYYYYYYSTHCLRTAARPRRTSFMKVGSLEQRLKTKMLPFFRKRDWSFFAEEVSVLFCSFSSCFLKVLVLPFHFFQYVLHTYVCFLIHEWRKSIARD